MELNIIKCVANITLLLLNFACSNAPYCNTENSYNILLYRSKRVSSILHDSFFYSLRKVASGIALKYFHVSATSENPQNLCEAKV